jgi:oligoendopeptidase F
MTHRPFTHSVLRDPFAGVATEGADLVRDRTSVPAKYVWNLGDVYPSVSSWRAAKDDLTSRVSHLRLFENQLGSSATVLADALDEFFQMDKELGRTFVFAGLSADEDTRDTAAQGRRQEMVRLSADFSAAAAFIEPEILGLPEGTVARFLAAEPRLAVYRFYLEDIVRRAPHTLTPGEEKILADAKPLAGSPSDVYTIFTNADFPYPRVQLADGREVTANQVTFSVIRASSNRHDREAVMSAYFTALGSFGRTLGTTMNGSLQKALFYARARRYDSALAAALDSPNIPLSVYTRLVDGVNRSLRSFHRYLTLRKRLLGVDELHYYDLYAPLVASVDLTYTPEEAQGHILMAMAPLGRGYTAGLERAFGERWIDMFPTPHKRSGAYSQGGAYDVHPYILMNYNGRFDDMSTLAHELGHTMQSYLSNTTQPYATADYPTFVAEVASTFNEALLIDYMLRTIQDDDVRLTVLGNYLEGIKGTIFRQTQFAEFELAMHEMARKGEPVTGETLARLYLDITRRYYGHDQGVLVVDDYVAHEWSFIPHFYREFYVFQYATSFTASEALAQKVKAGERGAVDRYLAFLSAGGSKYPVDLLRDAGVDMTTDEPLDLTMKEMNRVMDEMEAILARRAT